MLFPVHLSLLAALLVTMTAMASHIPNQSRQHRNNLHRRVVRRVVRDCSGDATVSSAVSMSTRVPYSSTGAPRSTPPSSSTASPVSPYATVVALPDSANNVPFAQNADTNSTDVSFTLTDGANPDSNASASILGEVAETVNAIAQNVEYSYAVSSNGTDLEADLFLAGVYLASDYDTSLDGPEPETKRRGLSSRRRRAGVCNHGDWRCTDMDLERCIWGTWTLIRACSGVNIVCSDAPATTGCVWTWSVQPQAVSPSVTTAEAVVTTGAGRPQSASMPAATTSAISHLLVNAGPTEAAPTLTTTSAPTSTPSSGTGTGEEDDEDCEEWEFVSASSTITSATLPIGNGFFANATVTSAPSGSATVSPSNITSSLNTSVNSASPANVTASISFNSTNVANGTVSISATPTAFPSNVQVTASASGAILSNLTNPSKTLSLINASTIALSTTSLTASATAGVVTGSPEGIATYSAPHYVVYSDLWLNQMPSVSDLKSFNRFILAFWLSDVGPVDNAQMWMWMSPADRQAVLDEYHAAGIALMVSAFGSTDQPTTYGKDPIETAQSLAKFVIAYGLDGVDIDYEDMGAMNSNIAEAWLVSFQQELRRLLPSPYLISHAPVAPWFTSAAVYKTGAYVAVHQTVGDTIDFYNVQFYNQGDGVYEDCSSLIQQSGGYWPGTSVMEINSYAGVPLNKIVIGKPLDAGKASNGYTDPALLHQCVYQARQQGWNGGIMFWEWTSTAPGIMATARG